MITCSCGREVLKKNLKRHLASRNHKVEEEEPKNEMKEKEPKEEDEEEENEKGEYENSMKVEFEDDDVENNEFGIDSNDFLAEFANDQFQQEPSKDELAEIKREAQILKEKQKLEQLKAKESKKYQKEAKPEPEDEIFSQQGSEIIGKEKRLLMAKIIQYKSLFKAELKSFKVKRNATVEELQAYVNEMEVIVSVDSTQTFVMDGIYGSLMMIEGVSANTRDYDISGLTNILKQNPQFQIVAKQLYLKYGSWAKCPPEAQMVFILITSGYICAQMNKKRKMAAAGGV